MTVNLFRKAACPLIFLMFIPFIPAQEVPAGGEETVGDDPIQVEVHLVNIEARVTRNGEPVKDLTRDDFLLKENGKEQDIAFFYYVEAPARIDRDAGPSGTRQFQAVPGAGRSTSREITDLASIVPTPQEEATDPTWLHLVTETEDPLEFRRTAKAIREFVEEEMQPGFYVSLGGMPFTDNKAMLLATLDRLEGKPYGPGSGIDPSMVHLNDLEEMRNIAISLPFNPDVIAIEDALQATAVFEGPIDLAPVLGVDTVNRQIRFFGELAMLRYMDLVERMALLPGRKLIVLFRNGLRLDHETEPILDRLLSMAARNRVSFYTVDSRGLDVVSPVKDLRYPLAWSRGRLEKYLPDPMAENDRRREAEEGLVVLARETGGWAVLDNNDLGSILKRAARDSFSYYVLGYYPENFTYNGRFRRIEVALKKEIKSEGYNVAAVRGYVEPKRLRLQSRAERLVSLRKSLEVSNSRDLKVEVEPEIFAGPDGNPVLFLGVGVPARDFELKKNSRKSRAEGEILIQIVNRFSQKIPLYHEGKIEEEFDNSSLDGSAPGPIINYQTVLPLGPGLYELRAVIRDSRSGKTGVQSSSFLVGSFAASSVPSSLLITRYATRADGEAVKPEDWYSQILSAGETGFFPQADSEFHRGEIVHVLFHLYHPTQADRDWAEKGMQIGIFRNEVIVPGVKAHGQAFLDADEDVIRYAAMFDTSTLGPGEYSFMALLPNYETRRVPHLEESFSVIDP